MIIYRDSYKGRDGKIRKSAKWYCDFRDHFEVRRKTPAFTDKRQSEAFGRNIENLVNSKKAGLDVDDKLNQWLNDLPDSTMAKFSSWGLIDGQRAEITKTLSAHITDYIGILETKAKHHYARITQTRLEKIIKDCKFNFFRDISKSAIEVYIGRLKKELTPTTAGHYQGALMAFLNWAVEDSRILNNPISKLEKPARDSEQKGILEPQQFIDLIRTTFEKNILIDNIGGQERAILYISAGTTGFRKAELLSLQWYNIDLENACIRIRSSATKNAKEALQPLPPVAVKMLAAYKAFTKATDTDKVFSFTRTVNTADLIRADLTTAEIPLFDKDGNEIVFHSLRNSYISFLANSTTPPKVVQELARHSDPRLTFNTYARVLAESKQTAISFLPNVGGFVMNFVTDSSSDTVCAPIRAGANFDEQKSLDNGLKTPILSNAQIAKVGFEPI